MKLRTITLGSTALAAFLAALLGHAIAEPAVPAVTGRSDIPVAQTQMAGGAIPITSVSNATTTLKSVWVEDSDGKKVGKVLMVRLDGNGQPFSLDVMIEDRLVALDVAKAAYDPVNKVVETHLSHAELKALPTPSAVTMPPATPKPY